MATLGSDKVTGVSVVSNPTDAVNLTYVNTNKERYQSPLGSDVGKFVQYAGSAYYWNLRTSGFGTTDITAASYGNEYYVIGGSKTLSSSTDAITWSLRTTGTSQTFNQIIYGDEEISGKNIFVAGSSGGAVRSSTDSISWFLRSSGFGSTAISGATYSTLSGGEFLLGGASTTVTDWWTLRTSGSTTSLVTTVYGDLPVPTYLVKLYNSRSIRGSTDGIIWRARTNGGSGTIIYSVGYGFVGDQQLYISVDSNSQINTSTDSITWTLRTSGQSTTLNFLTVSSGSLGLDKENFVAGGSGPSLRSSTDGIHWVARTSTGFGTTSISASGYGGGLYFIGGVSASSPARAPLNVSTDGIVWSRRTSGTSLNIHGFAYGTNNGVPNYIFYGQSGLLATSTDTNTWIIRTVGNTSDIGLPASTSSNGFGTAVTYNNGIYILVNTGGGCRVSTDAITWTIKDFSAEVTAAYSIAYGNNYYFVGANDGVLCVSTQDISTSQPLVSSLGIGALLRASTDSITWTARTTGYGTQSISVLGFGGSYALAYGTNDINTPFLSASTDNITWTFRTSGFGLTTINAFTYGNQIYVAAGNSGLLSTSTDSFTWTIRTSGSSSNFQALTYGNNAYISGTSGGGIRFSTDAIIWTLRTSNSSYEINILIYGNNTYLSGETSGALETSITGRVAWQSINLPSSSIEVPTYKGAEEFTIPGAKSFIIPPTASQFYIECIGAGGGGASGRIRGTLGSGGGGGSGAYNSWLIRRSELGSAETITVTPGTGGQGGTNRGLSTSTDGIIWTVSPFDASSITSTPFVSGYGNGLYVVAGDSASVFVSTDASSWTLRTSGIAGTQVIGNGYGNAFVYGDKYVIAAITGGFLSTSTDTITWTPRTIPAGNITNIIYGNNLYVTTNGYNTGNFLFTSVDAITWILRTVGYTTSSGSCGLAFANTANTGNENRYVYADTASRFATSTNAIYWTFRTSGTTATIYQFINDGTNYYGVGTAGTLMVSTNAIQWSFRTSGFGSTNINSITYNASLTEKYLIGGDAGLTKTSTDGFVWVARTSLFKDQNVNTVSNGNNIYIAAGSLTSTPTAGTETAVSWTGNGPSGTVTYLLGAGGGTAASDTAVTGGTGATAAPIYRNALYTTDGLAGGNGRSVNGEARDSTQVNAFQVTGGGGGAFNTNTGGSGLAYYYGNTYTNGGNTSGTNGADGIPGSYTGNIGGGGGGGGALSSGFNTWIIRTSGFTNAVIGLAYGSSTYLANNNGLRGSTDSINWQLRTAGFGSTSVASITYSSFNNGEFLAGGRVETQIWTQRTSGTTASINSAMYDGTNFFIGGASGFLSVSTDGISWILRTSGTSGSIGTASFGGNGLVYAAGETNPYVYWSGSGICSSSTDGIAWTLRTSGLVTPYAIAFGASPTQTYVIGGASGRINTSTNSIIWVLRTFGATNNINSIVYNDAITNKYVAAGETGIISTSTNAIQWTLRTSGNGSLTIYQIIYGNVFVAAGRNGVLSTSTNAIQWTLRTSGFGTTVFGLAYNNGIYIASGSSGSSRSSTDAIIWTLRTSGFGTTTINNSVAGNNIFINVGSTGTITASTQIVLNSYGLGALLQASTDSITWTARTTSLNTQTITSLGFGGSYVFAHGTNYMNEVGFLNVSTDNIIWVLRTSGFGSTAITEFGYGASSPTAYYVAIGNNQLSSSTDTITWQTRTTSFGANIINAFVYGDNYIAAGPSGIISYSTDSISWTLRTSGFGTTNISSLVYGNSVYVAGGDAGTLRISTDAIVWERKNSGFGTTAINALTYGTSYVAGGNNGTITVSAGGTSQSVAGNGGNGTRGGGGGGGAYSVEQGKFGIGGDGGDGYVKITWW